MSIPAEDFVEGCRKFEEVRYGEEEKVGDGDGAASWESVRMAEWYGAAYLHITRRLPRAAATAKTGAGNGGMEESGIEQEEDEEDDSTLPRQPQTGLVVYDIVHSPSYQVPVLYITFQHLPSAGLPSPQEMYELLVPDAYKPQLEAVGVTGSLSMTEHPVLGSPAYFVHPCRTAEAISAIIPSRQRELRPEEYLLAWLGMMGPCVGLTVPTRMAQRMSAIPSGKWTGD